MQPQEVRPYLDSRGSALFEQGYSWTGPALQADGVCGSGVADFAGARTRVVGTLLPSTLVRKLGRGRPRNPVRRLFRKGVAALNSPTEWEFAAGRALVRHGPEEKWEEVAEPDADSPGRENHPLMLLDETGEQGERRWVVDADDPGELTIGAWTPPDDPSNPGMWSILRFHDFGTRFGEPDLWARYDAAVNT